jgi:hypothetical protein
LQGASALVSKQGNNVIQRFAAESQIYFLTTRRETGIREVLIHGNYRSQRDIEICLDFDLGTLGPHLAYKNMRDLHQILVTTYGSVDERRAA